MGNLFNLEEKIGSRIELKLRNEKLCFREKVSGSLHKVIFTGIDSVQLLYDMTWQDYLRETPIKIGKHRWGGIFKWPRIDRRPKAALYFLPKLKKVNTMKSICDNVFMANNATFSHRKNLEHPLNALHIGGKWKFCALRRMFFFRYTLVKMKHCFTIEFFVDLFSHFRFRKWTKKILAVFFEVTHLIVFNFNQLIGNFFTLIVDSDRFFCGNSNWTTFGQFQLKTSWNELFFLKHRSWLVSDCIIAIFFTVEHNVKCSSWNHEIKYFSNESIRSRVNRWIDKIGPHVYRTMLMEPPLRPLESSFLEFKLERCLHGTLVTEHWKVIWVQAWSSFWLSLSGYSRCAYCAYFWILTESLFSTQKSCHI